jgi:hypothetical protein
MLSDIGDLAHSGESHVRSPGDDTGGEGCVVRRLSGMAAEDMCEGIGEPALAICETQDSMDVRLRQLVEEGMLRSLSFAGVFQCPACLMAVGFDLEVLVLSCGDTPVDLRDACLKLFFQLRQMLFDRLIQEFGQISIFGDYKCSELSAFPKCFLR